MQRSLSGIHGVPLRKIISRHEERGIWIETLKCGHTKTCEFKESATFRRCYTCRFEKQQAAKAEKHV